MWVEVIGYIGSALVVVSMLMTSVMKLRVINMIGSLIFAGYALIIKSYPTALMNIALVIINIVNMKKLLSNSNTYSLVETTSDDSFVKTYLNKYNEDIKKFFPDYKGINQNDKVYLIMNEDQLAGITAGKKDGNIFYIDLDYSTPVYRDCSAGEFLFSELKKEGFAKAVFNNPSQDHLSYLKKMGFVKSGNDYIKTL